MTAETKAPVRPAPLEITHPQCEAHYEDLTVRLRSTEYGPMIFRRGVLSSLITCLRLHVCESAMDDTEAGKNRDRDVSGVLSRMAEGIQSQDIAVHVLKCVEYIQAWNNLTMVKVPRPSPFQVTVDIPEEEFRDLYEALRQCPSIPVLIRKDSIVEDFYTFLIQNLCDVAIDRCEKKDMPVESIIGCLMDTIPETDREDLRDYLKTTIAYIHSRHFEGTVH